MSNQPTLPQIRPPLRRLVSNLVESQLKSSLAQVAWSIFISFHFHPLLLFALKRQRTLSALWPIKSKLQQKSTIRVWRSVWVFKSNLFSESMVCWYLHSKLRNKRRHHVNDKIINAANQARLRERTKGHCATFSFFFLWQFGFSPTFL